MYVNLELGTRGFAYYSTDMTKLIEDCHFYIDKIDKIYTLDHYKNLLTVGETRITFGVKQHYCYISFASDNNTYITTLKNTIDDFFMDKYSKCLIKSEQDNFPIR